MAVYNMLPADTGDARSSTRPAPGPWWSKRYRICRDHYAGFEVQVWCWWWPFWRCVGTNTHGSVENAERWAVREAQRVVKYLGALSDGALARQDDAPGTEPDIATKPST